MLIGTGIAAAAAAAAGAVYLYGTKAGAKRRKQIRGWMLKMKGDVLNNIEKMKDVSESAYYQAVDNVAKGYEKMKQVDPVELAALVQDLKGHWTAIRKQVREPAKKTKPKKTTKTPKTAK